MVGSVLSNRYELLENIGAGGMAIVYKARCRLLNRFVAVKILRPEFQEDEEFLKRFTIEAQAAASLSHPNVVSVFDVGKHGKLNYIVMECIEGITLKEYMKRKGVLSINEAVDFTGQIASALEHAHAKGIIHRDIKPHNIILTNDGVLKVTDFGLARAVSASTNVANSNSAIGSVHYASPEQARGGFTDERSDIYSLGVVMYEMFTGTLPFNGETPVAIAMQHIQDAPMPPSLKNSQIHAGIEKIILRSLEKDINARYPSVTSLLFDFKTNFNSDIASVGHPDKFSTKKLPKIPAEEELELRQAEKKHKPKKEDKVAIVAAIVTAVLLICLIGFMMIKFLVSNKKTSGAKFSVPNLVNTYFEDAQVRYPDFIIEKKASGYSKNIPEGYIIEQDIQEGQEATKGTTILVTVSLGQQKVEMPNFKDKNADDLVRELKKLGLNTEPEIIFENSDEVEKDNVIRTNPAENSQFSVYSDVKIYVSEGKSVVEVAVPYLIGKTEDEAKELLKQNDLLVGEVSRVMHGAKKGTVIKQSESAGTMISSGTAIDIVLSLGEDETTENGNAILVLSDLPDDKDTVEIVIKKEDTVIFRANYKTELSPITINLSGRVGVSQVDIYLDGEIYKSGVNVTFK